MAKAGAQLSESGVKYYGTLSLPPGTYAISSSAIKPTRANAAVMRVGLI